MAIKTVVINSLEEMASAAARLVTPPTDPREVVEFVRMVDAANTAGGVTRLLEVLGISLRIEMSIGAPEAGVDTAPPSTPHPGYYIREEMASRGMSVRDLAAAVGMQQSGVNLILSGKWGIGPDMARALGKAFDAPAEFFSNLQKAFDSR